MALQRYLLLSGASGTSSGSLVQSSEDEKLVAKDGKSGDRFGSSVSVDGGTIVVGAMHEDSGGNKNAGSAYVFTRKGGRVATLPKFLRKLWPTWGQEVKLNAADPQPGDLFGTSVDIDGDTVLVGAMYDYSKGKSNAGSTYVFRRNGGFLFWRPTWVQEARLVSDDTQQLGSFGTSVSVDGRTALVGAAFEAPNGATKAGAAYIFRRTNSPLSLWRPTWAQEAKLVANDAQVDDQFGISVSVDGDTALVGARFKDHGGRRETGAAYVFTRSKGWTQQQKLIPDRISNGSNFGTSVSIDGDTALVGAEGDSLPGVTSVGTAYVFTRSGETWSEQARLVAKDAEALDKFGWSVSVDGDTALVGAVEKDQGGKSDSGAVYVFERNGTTWTQRAKYVADDAEPGDNFGWSVSVDGDTALVGAMLESPGGEVRAGSAYVFE